jgi:hypothetical protein
MLLIRSNVHVVYGVFLWMDFQTLIELMSSNQQSAIMCDLEYSNNPLAVTHCNERLSWVDMNGRKSQVLCTLVRLFTRVGKWVIKALDNIDERKGPAVSEVAPNKDAHVTTASNKCWHLCIIWERLFIYRRLCDPLYLWNSLEVPERVAHNCLWRRCDRTVDHYEGMICVLNHKIPHVHRCWDKLHWRTHFEEGKLILLSKILFIVFCE